MMACCVLHNISMNDAMDVDLRHMIDMEPSQPAAPPTGAANEAGMGTATTKRNNIAEMLLR